MTTTNANTATTILVSTLMCDCQKGEEFPQIFEGCQPVKLLTTTQNSEFIERLINLASWIRCPHHESQAATYVARARSVLEGPGIQPVLVNRYMVRALEESYRDQMQALHVVADLRSRKQMAEYVKTQGWSVSVADQECTHALAHVESMNIDLSLRFALLVLTARTRIDKGCALR